MKHIVSRLIVRLTCKECGHYTEKPHGICDSMNDDLRCDNCNALAFDLMRREVLNNDERRIKCSAIKYNGTIYEGDKHSDIGSKLISDKICPSPFPGGENQGFVTEDGEFVSREEAMVIAIEAGQVIEGKTISKRKLFSEDLR